MTQRPLTVIARVLGVGRVATGYGGRFENATNAQRDVVDGSSFSADGERLLVEPFVEAGIGLGRVWCRAHVVQKELMKTRSNLQEFVALRALRRRGWHRQRRRARQHRDRLEPDDHRLHR